MAADLLESLDASWYLRRWRSHALTHMLRRGNIYCLNCDVELARCVCSRQVDRISLPASSLGTAPAGPQTSLNAVLLMLTSTHRLTQLSKLSLISIKKL
jgi:hypothetical protein